MATKVVKKAPTAKAAPAKKPTDRMAALRAARGAGGAAKKPGVKRAPNPNKIPPVTFPGPSDFKPFFLEFSFRAGEDGLLMPKFSIKRVRGRYDNPDAKRFNMMEYDPHTALALVSRFSGKLFTPTQWRIVKDEDGEVVKDKDGEIKKTTRRLTPNTSFQAIIRVSLRRKKNAKGRVISESLGTRVVAVARYVKKEGGKSTPMWFNPKEKEAHKNNKDRKLITATGRFLAGAFVTALLPPSGRKPKAAEE